MGWRRWGGGGVEEGGGRGAMCPMRAWNATMVASLMTLIVTGMLGSRCSTHSHVSDAHTRRCSSPSLPPTTSPPSGSSSRCKAADAAMRVAQACLTTAERRSTSCAMRMRRCWCRRGMKLG